MNRKLLYDDIEQLMQEFCHECFLYKFHREEKGRCYAHRFCITKCTVGEKIKAFGSKLEGKNNKIEENK